MPVVPITQNRPQAVADPVAARQAMLAKTIPDDYQLMAAAYMHNIGRLFPQPVPELASSTKPAQAKS